MPNLLAHAALAAALALPTAALAQSRALPAPITDADYALVAEAEAKLGQLLFWDPILSGNRNIACVTCHHPRFGTSDGVSLGLGEGGTGLGPDRKPMAKNLPEQRIPRNAPALFNLGAREFTTLFHDGRIQADPTRASGFRTPLEDEMVQGFASILSAQTMFPVLSNDEMAGHYEENEVSTAVREGLITGPKGAWNLLALRVAAIPAYAEMFAAAYPEIAAGRPIGFTDISNAIAAFIEVEWRSDTAPFDAWLRGTGTLKPQEQLGLALFYGSAGCSACHSGKFQTDQSFHAMGEPQLGPGKAERFESHSRDVGRMRVTNNPADAYAFRTPSLRNVTATAPYGHAGAHKTLESFLAYHADPKTGLASYEDDTVLPAFQPNKPDWLIMDTPDERDAIAAAVTTQPVLLQAEQIAALVAFLKTLEDPVALKGRFGVPDAVPSGLPLDR
ncbi:cytochrome-c peroxidase [Rhodobacter ferrooxidans]|uniref:Di-heme cytochrome c peroxidase n=1 Tax=Rhodobacter ferrooxidans TaxID=371731 RepID=C8S234_9RHOB|nr:cytochrome c peroxidase [Rhodobacter sp. SW2]EEW24906.1 Di-heme cytochrome c peroxidase [Rhodobacter sp. SW2]